MSIAFKNTLLVEDEPQLAIAAEQLLLDCGVAEVRIAENAADALKLAARQPFDLVICDLGLPGKDGLWLLRELSALSDPPAVILLSGVDPSLLRTAEHLTRQMGLNVLGALGKPPTEAALRPLLSGSEGGLYIAPRHPKTGDASLVPDAVLLQGLERHWYQPWFEARIGADGTVIGGELLARLCMPAGKTVMPDQFINRLEAQGRIADMTWLVAEPGFALARELRAGGQRFNVSLNISSRMLADDTLLDWLDRQASSGNLSPRDTTLEITESAAIDSSPGVLERLVHLRLRGYGLAIDDFGTGFSSLAQLSKMPFTEMKIDQMFSANAIHDSRARAVVESSIGLARRLGIKTCAEGVDSAAVYQLMGDLGADSFQGYHFHKPLPAREFSQWVRDWPARAS